MIFLVEIGSYKRGIVKHIEADTAKEVYNIAHKMILDNNLLNEEGEEAEVVQIFSNDRKKCFFDYINGFELYE